MFYLTQSILSIVTYPRNQYKIYRWDILYYFSVSHLWNLVCMSYSKQISVQTGYISNARSSHMSNGIHIGQCSSKAGLWVSCANRALPAQRQPPGAHLWGSGAVARAPPQQWAGRCQVKCLSTAKPCARDRNQSQQSQRWLLHWLVFPALSPPDFMLVSE